MMVSKSDALEAMTIAKDIKIFWIVNCSVGICRPSIRLGLLTSGVFIALFILDFGMGGSFNMPGWVDDGVDESALIPLAWFALRFCTPVVIRVMTHA